jgi:hypothetical protein
MFASITLLALWAGSHQIETLSLKWEQDYRQAHVLAINAKKPLAVFVGTGAEGWKKIVRDGQIDANTQKVLADQYVIVYVDQTTESGKKLAGALQLSGKQGLVISNRAGDLQAYRHEGGLSNSELASRLNRYANPRFVVTTTESNAPQVIQANYVNPFRGNCPYCH